MPDYTPGQRLQLADGRTATVGDDGVPRFDAPAQASAPPSYRGDAARAPAPPPPPTPLQVNADARANAAAERDAARLRLAEEAAARAASKTSMRPVPPPDMRRYMDINQGIGKMEGALGEISRYPDGLGLENVLPDEWQQRADPQGINVRAAIGDIGSVIIHDRSGAAVTLSEAPRFKPFVPRITDSPEAARKKTERLLSMLADEGISMQGLYSQDQGYRGLPDRGTEANPVVGLSDAQIQGLPDGQWAVSSDGRRLRVGASGRVNQRNAARANPSAAAPGPQGTGGLGAMGGMTRRDRANQVMRERSPPARPKGVPANARWDPATRTWEAR